MQFVSDIVHGEAATAACETAPALEADPKRLTSRRASSMLSAEGGATVFCEADAPDTERKRNVSMSSFALLRVFLHSHDFFTSSPDVQLRESRDCDESM
eukprot:7385159-Prymnesium_polylepis.2